MKPVSPPAGSALAEAWRARIVLALEDGVARLRDRSMPPERRIRKGRQATKVAKALLRLAPPGLKRQARGILLALAGVRRGLSEARETDAVAAALNALITPMKLTPPQRRALLAPLRGGPAPRNRRIDDAEQAAATLGRIIAQVAGWKPPRGRDKAVAEAIVADYRRLRRDAGAGLDRLDIEDLHDLRKRVITHRHQLAFLAALAEGDAAAKLRKREHRAKLLNDAIGGHRDLDMAVAYLRTLEAPKIAGARDALTAAARRRQAQLLETAVALGDEVMRRTPKRLLRG